jgi:hypothetical protein
LGLAGIVVAFGLITIANLTIKGFLIAKAFVLNPLGDILEFEQVHTPNKDSIRVVLFDVESQELREMTAYNVGDPAQTRRKPLYYSGRD